MAVKQNYIEQKIPAGETREAMTVRGTKSRKSQRGTKTTASQKELEGEPIAPAELSRHIDAK